VDEQTERRHQDDDWGAANEAQRLALQHFYSHIGSTPPPSTIPAFLQKRLGITLQKRLGITERDGKLHLRHRLIPTTAVIQENVTGSFTAGVFRGSIGALASYSRGEWDTDDLYSLSQYLLFAEEILSYAKPFAHLWQQKHDPCSHAQEESSLHYDLPPALFAAITDGLSYSAIRWRYEPLAPAAATQAHYQRILAVAGIPAEGGAVLDLGSGWGAFSDYVLDHTNLQISCVTLSIQQFNSLCEKYASEPRAEPLLMDFREVERLPSHADIVTLFESIEHLSPSDRVILIKALRRRFPHASLVIQTTCRRGFAATMRSGTGGALNEVIFPGPGTLATRKEILKSAHEAGYLVAQEQDLTAEYAYSALLWARRHDTYHTDGKAGVPPIISRAFSFYLNAMAASLACRRVSSNLFVFRPGP
jgi:cyclopropane-fatty-acyl-phospholipid synthase